MWSFLSNILIVILIDYLFSVFSSISAMVLILDGNSDFVARAWRKIDIFGEKSDLHDYSQSNRALNRSNNRDFSLYVRTYFLVTILYISTMIPAPCITFCRGAGKLLFFFYPWSRIQIFQLCGSGFWNMVGSGSGLQNYYFYPDPV